MRWPVLSLLDRELHLDARSWKGYAFRVAMLIVIWLCLYGAEKTSRFVGAPGKKFFVSLMVVDLILVTLAGLSVFAAAITEEKEERTLGLMRMTALNPVAILLGKSSAKLMTVLVLLVAQVPFTLLAVAMGGVSTTQIIAAYVLLAAYVVFVANAALFWSVVCKRTAWAAVLMAGTLFAILALPAWIMVTKPLRMIMRGMYGSYSQPPATEGFQFFLVRCTEFCAWWTQQATAMGGMRRIFATGFDDPVMSTAVWVNLGMGTGFFLMALLVFDLFARNETDSGPARGLLARSRKGWRLLGAGRAWKRSILWKDFYFINGGWTMMVVKLIVFTILSAALISYLASFGGKMKSRDFGAWLMGWSVFFMAIEAVSHSAKMFAVERRWTTLSALVGLPISARWLWYAKLFAGLPRLLPWGLVFVVGACISPDSFHDAVTELVDEEETYYILCVAVFFLHLVVWLSLRIRRWAILVAVGVMMVLWVLLVLLANIDNSLAIAALLGFGVMAVMFHVLMPREIERAAASE